MAWFSRDRTKEPKRRTSPAFAKIGRRFSTMQHTPAVAATLQDVLNQAAPTPYKHMPALTPARATWSGSAGSGASSYACAFPPDDQFVVMIWSEASGSTAGLFPLGGAETSLQTPLVDLWKRADPTLTSRGRFDDGVVELRTPQVDAEYFLETLRLAGKAPSDRNLCLLRDKTRELLVIKSFQFIQAGHLGFGAAKEFALQHQSSETVADVQSVLDDLATISPGAVPYLQDLPWRIRALLLREPPGRDTFFDGLE
jgi:hypothetical protein